MIPAAFDYVRASSAEEAISLLGQYGDEAKLLAGGHSLIPLMKLRLAQPTVLVDIGRVSDLSYIRVAPSEGRSHTLIQHQIFRPRRSPSAPPMWSPGRTELVKSQPRTSIRVT